MNITNNIRNNSIPTPIRNLVKDVQTRCSDNDNTLCMYTKTTANNILKSKGYKNKAFTLLDEILSNRFYTVKLIIKYTYLMKNKRKVNTAIGHAMLLYKDKDNLYRIDSWEGIHPFLAKKVHKNWLNDFKDFLETVQTTGIIKKETFITLFGSWEKEKKKLANAGEYINDYPEDAILTDPIVKVEMVELSL